MISDSIGAMSAKTAPECDDWSEIETLLAAPGKAPQSIPVAAKRLPRRLAFGVIALVALGGGSVVLKAAIMPGCGGDACATRLEALVSPGPALRDVTEMPVRIAVAEPHDATPPMLQGRSIGTAAPGRRPRLRVPRRAAIPHPRFVAAKPPSRPRITAHAPATAPVRRQATARPMMTRQAAMQSVPSRSARLQRVFLSPTRFIFVERR